MTKTVDNNSHTDAYLNISLTNRDSIYPGVYYYKNFMLDGEFLFQGTGLLDAPLVFVGDKTSGSWIEQGLVRLSGNKLIGPGATLYSDLKENVWYHIQVFVDENVHRFHVYLENEDGEME